MITLLKNQYVQTSIGYCLLGLGLVFAAEPGLYSLAFSLGACLTMMTLTWLLMKLGISAIALQISSILTFAYGTFKSLEDFVSFHALAGHLGTSLIIVGAVFLTVALKRIAESQHTE